MLLLGVFSEPIACALEMYKGENPGFTETAKFVKFIFNIWKIMSIRTPEKGIVCVMKSFKLSNNIPYLSDCKPPLKVSLTYNCKT